MQDMTDGPLGVTKLLAEPDESAQLRELLRDVIDPELGVDVVSLGLIYDVAVNGRSVAVTATTTTPACPLGEYIHDEIERVLLESGAVDQVAIEITYNPRWTPDMMSEATKRGFGW